MPPKKRHRESIRDKLRASYLRFRKAEYIEVGIGLEGPQLNLPKSHRLALHGQYDSLRKVLGKVDHNLKDVGGRTVLHCAASCPNSKLALETVNVILDHPAVSPEKNNIEMLKPFLDIQDCRGNTALHYAAKTELSKVVDRLMWLAADVNLKNQDGIDSLSLVYSRTPGALLSFFDSGVRVKKGCEIADENLRLILDFGAIIGFDPEELDYRNRKHYPVETQLLVYALDRPVNSKDVLTHPLVQVFMEFKWHKIRKFFFASVIFHVLWLLLYTVFVTRVYRQQCCCYDASGGAATENKTFNSFTWFGLSSEEQEPEPRLLNQCVPNAVNSIIIYALLIFTGIVMLKEFFEMYSMRVFWSYFKGKENIGQWLLIIAILTLTLPLVSSHVIYPWMYEIAAFGIFLAWTLVLTQIGKHPRLSLHVEILGKVLQSLSMFILVFSSLLMAFALSLSLVLPENPSFASLPLAYMKVVVMMIGDLDYTGIFDEERQTAFPVSGRIIYLMFVMVVSITLLNLLIGFTVSDIQGLQKRAEVNKQSNQLEQVWLMESFLLSKNVQKILGSKRHWLTTFLVAPPNSKLDLEIEVSIKEIPRPFRKQLRLLAATNSGMLTLDLVKDTEKEELARTRELVRQVLEELMANSQFRSTLNMPSAPVPDTRT